MQHRFRAVACLGLTAVSLGVAACGSTQQTSTAQQKSSPTAGNKTANESPAAAYLAKFGANPTSIGVPSGAGKPPRGKSVIYLATPLPVATRQAEGLAAAAKTLGWSFTSLPFGATPSSAVSAFQAAISRHPSVIIWGGYPASLFKPEIQQAQKAGIALLTSATGDPQTPGVLADMGGATQEQQYGRLVAAYFVSHAGTGAHAVVFNISGLPILSAYQTAFTSAVKQWCPSCSVSSVPQQLSQIGTSTPSNVVTYLQRNPGTKWLVFGNGDLATGVVPALKTAGIDGTHIIGEVPTQSDLENVGGGTEEMWAGYPVDVLSWRMIDLLVRDFEGASIAPAAVPNLPTQPITKANLKSVVSDGQYYVGIAGYQSKFARVWHVN